MAATNMAALPLDPGRGVTWIVDEVDSAAERDPSVGRAKELIEERIGQLSDDDRAGLASVLWMWLRQYVLCYPFGWPPYSGVLIGIPPGLRAIRVGLADGDALLRGIEESLESALTPSALEAAGRQARDLATADPRRGEALSKLQDELAGGTDADVTPEGVAAVAAGVAVGLAVGWAASEIYHHHIAHDSSHHH